MPWAHRTMWGVYNLGDPWHWGLEINLGQLSHPAHGMIHSDHSQRVGSVSLHSHPLQNTPVFTKIHRIHASTASSAIRMTSPKPHGYGVVGRRGCGAATLRGWGLPQVASLPSLQVWKQMLLLFPEGHMARCHLWSPALKFQGPNAHGNYFLPQHTAGPSTGASPTWLLPDLCPHTCPS